MRWAPVVLCVGLVAGSLAAGSGAFIGVQDPPEREAPRQVFSERVDAYVALHRQLEQLLPPDVVTQDLAALFAPRIAMAREMRQARQRARQGDIFTPAVQAYFRTLIADTLRREGIADVLAIIEDENLVYTPARVNGDYPAGRSVPAIPPCILAALPTLPPEVRYSFVGRDLILWDLHAGLIVDYVPFAVPIPTTN